MTTLNSKQLADFATALIFDQDYGVLRYLSTAIDYNRVDTNASAAKVALLEFIARYVERIKASVQPYVRYIKVRCLIWLKIVSGLSLTVFIEMCLANDGG
jgi:hypothetical protein